MTDNFDLMARRKRLGLTQEDVIKALGVKRVADLSYFENGHAAGLRNGKGRAEYEAYLSALEKERR